MKKVLIGLYAALFLLPLSACTIFQYVYHERDKALVKGVDVDCTLNIAELKLKQGGFDSILTLWALRDQVITPNQAERINTLYSKYINEIKGEFGVWHMAWAVSNFYRLGDEAVRAKMQSSYDDALKRPDSMKQFKSIAAEHVKGAKIYMGYIHDLGKFYAKKHTVVPGNSEYIQSMDDFIAQNKDNKKLMQVINEEEWAKKCELGIKKS